jgi:hypothetical protein
VLRLIIIIINGDKNVKFESRSQWLKKKGIPGFRAGP